jgi:hypothetical protein
MYWLTCKPVAESESIFVSTRQAIQLFVFAAADSFVWHWLSKGDATNNRKPSKSRTKNSHRKVVMMSVQGRVRAEFDLIL